MKKQPDPLKTCKFRQSGLFIDQKVKISYPRKQRLLFEMLSSETRDKMSTQSLEIRAEGIRLTPSQDRLITALMRLLHEKSENKDEKSPYFYTGNGIAQIVPYGGKGQEGRSAIIRIRPAELYKAYLDSTDYSGASIRSIKSLLQDTEQQKFLIIYERKYEIVTNNGKRSNRTDRIEDFQSLFKILRFFEGLTDEEKKAIDSGNEDVRERRGELVIAFNPLLTDQINSKYIEYPADINRRTVIAAGGYKRITAGVNTLRDYVLREISCKRSHSEINEENLIHLLRLDNCLKEKRHKRIEMGIQSAIQAIKNLGLILTHERVLGAASQWKFIFHNNLDFE
jgi:hypothetical protein